MVSATPEGWGRPLSLLAGAALLAVACSGSPTGESTTTVGAAPATTTSAATTTSTPSPITTSTAASTTTVPNMPIPVDTTPVRITVVYDNYTYDPRFAGGWGFAALVEVSGQRILFDTGGDGRALLANLALFDIDPVSLDAVVLSHEHTDHTGGLAALLDTGATPVVYLPASFSSTLRNQAAAQTAVVEITGPREILPGVFTTGEVGGYIIEQALVVSTPVGNVVITGCAHPGIVEMVRRAKEASPAEVALVVGGFHLVETTPQRIAGIIEDFRALGVRGVAPTHCTGDPARDAFAREYGDDFVEAGVGRVIEVG